jgi:small subunit ribosomal protein S21
MGIPAIIVGEDEPLEKAVKRFKRMMEKEGVIREWRKREFYEKPSTIKNRKKKALERKRMKKLRKIRSSKRY